MISEIVTFPLPAGTDRKTALDLYRTTAATWAQNPDLVRKSYFLDETRGIGGGIYVWPSREAGARWHGDAYKAMVKRLYGSEPTIQIFDVLIEVDPASGSIIEIADRSLGTQP